jgi:NTE family protein
MVKIGTDHFWDGGIVSNTPLADVLDTQTEPMLVFQVDLFSAAGAVPRTIMDVFAREKEIRYSSRTRQVSDQLVKLRKERELIRKVLRKLPAELREDPDVAALRAQAAEHPVNVVHLIYRAPEWESGSRDYEFSARTMREHWDAGRSAVAETIDKAALLARNIVDGKTAAFDLTRK